MIDDRIFLGFPIDFQGICQIYPPTVNDVVGNKDFPIYQSLFTITQEELDTIKNFTHEPIREIRFGRFGQYVFNIYEDLDLSYPPIIGVDVAGATFNDSSAITVIDSKTTRVCANLNCNFIPADDLADVIYELVTKYMPSAIVVIERNGVEPFMY